MAVGPNGAKGGNSHSLYSLSSTNGVVLPVCRSLVLLEMGFKVALSQHQSRAVGWLGDDQTKMCLPIWVRSLFGTVSVALEIGVMMFSIQ